MQLPTYQLDAREEIRPLLPSAARRVLDVGCGPGGLGTTLRTAYPNARLVAVEAEPSQAEAARRFFDEVHEGYYPEALPVAVRDFDVITLTDVVEHLVDPWELLRSLTTRLAPGGVIVAAIPNVRHFTVSLPLVLRGSWTYADEGLLDRTHVRFFTRETIGELYASAGLTIEKMVGLNAPWDGNRRWRPLRRPTRAFHDLLHMHHGVVARPSPAALPRPSLS